MNGHQKDLIRLIWHIQDQHKYDDPLPEKAIHKLLFLANKKAEEKGLQLTIPYFWYQYGTLSPLPPQFTDEEPASNPSTGDDEFQEIASEVLTQYYATSLEELTDLMYQFAPYQVQQDWRDLDKKLRTHHPDYHDFYEVEPSRQSIRNSAKEVYKSFPLSQYPEYELDLIRWYTAITREVYNDEMSVERMMKVNTMFWGVFAITLAKNHRYEIDLEGVKRVLSVDSLDEVQRQRRESIRDLDSEGVQDKFEEYTLSEVESRAVSALAGTLIEK